MPRIAFTAHARRLLSEYGLSYADISDIIANYETFEFDPGGSGQMRVSKLIRDRRYYLVYRLAGTGLLIVTIEEQSDEDQL